MAPVSSDAGESPWCLELWNIIHNLSLTSSVQSGFGRQDWAMPHTLCWALCNSEKSQTISHRVCAILYSCQHLWEFWFSMSSTTWVIFCSVVFHGGHVLYGKGVLASALWVLGLQVCTTMLAPVFIFFLSFFFFFCFFGGTQGLHLEPLHQPFFVKGFFEIGSCGAICLELASNPDHTDLCLLSSKDYR
jgi:hypothetical protein